MAVEPFDPSSLPDVLDPSLPLSDDPIGQGDDHIRLLKTVVQNMYDDYLLRTATITSDLNDLEDLILNNPVTDALRLGGKLPAFYRNAGNLDAGTLDPARLSGTYGISITGNAATATTAGSATVANFAQDSNRFAGLTFAQLQDSLRPPIVKGTAVATKTVTTTYSTVVTLTIGVAPIVDTLCLMVGGCKVETGAPSGRGIYFQFESDTSLWLLGDGTVVGYNNRICNLGALIVWPAGETTIRLNLATTTAPNITTSNHSISGFLL